MTTYLTVTENVYTDNGQLPDIVLLLLNVVRKTSVPL